MAGNWQMVMNSRWAVFPSMASMLGFSPSHKPTCSGLAHGEMSGGVRH